MKKYLYWAWTSWRGVCSPHFSSKAKALEWKKHRGILNKISLMAVYNPEYLKEREKNDN